MKIAFLLGSINGSGGIARSTSIVAKYLSQDISNEISIISYFNSLTENKAVNSSILYITIFDKQINMKKGFWKARKIIHEFLKVNDVDVLISCGALYFILGAVSAIGLKTKTIAWEHSNYTSNNGHSGKKYTRKIGAKISDYVITLTKMDQENYLKNIRKNNVEFIYNPIDPLLLEKEEKYRPNEKKIITVGNLNPFKNYNDLIKVAAKIFSNDDFQDWQWHIFGEGAKREEIEKLITKNGLSSKVILKGHANNIYNLLNNYSIYVCTSKSEGLPMALIEAKAKKLPIVSFDIMTGPRDIIADGINGYLVKPYDVDAMARKLKLLMSSDEKRKELSSNAHMDIEKFYVEECMNKWYTLLNKCVPIKKAR